MQAWLWGRMAPLAAPTAGTAGSATGRAFAEAVPQQQWQSFPAKSTAPGGLRWTRAFPHTIPGDPYLQRPRPQRFLVGVAAAAARQQPEGSTAARSHRRLPHGTQVLGEPPGRAAGLQLPAAPAPPRPRLPALPLARPAGGCSSTAPPASAADLLLLPNEALRGRERS